MTNRLTDDERQRRLDRLRLILTDVDGVLTDGGIEYGVTGEELRRFNARDGLAVELLRDAGLSTGFLSRDHAPMVLQRARKLHVPHVFLGVGNKAAQLPALLDEAGVSPEEVLYVGDDLDDVDVFRRVGEVGLTAAPADAVPELRSLAHFVTTASGGHGAFRELADTVRGLRRRAP
jgi:YrbI family 3-deoxy-D-manno-octulosonate 8-phosphate phosphatase